eukprot:CAMPEP_0172445038 /NCGR_PEP_ID=MMETSP1065-20121228/5021_1 /TAXON_ID=265537 /ORGANISM="Amphiprora paludosa, Strain CCMP125" /LENGTH=503 /DNA_ID=CAMNT_0013195831 /DNA_START=165 /DNA_END=1676 /DNA_ORIENTATION=+
MADATKVEEKTEEEAEKEAVVVPPLEAAALRLEKSLGAYQSSEKDASSYSYYSNPAKVVRRWLSTSSGASGQATLEDISQAAQALLDPATTTKLELLVTSTAMTTEDDTTPPTYLKAAAIQVQTWLLSLKARLLWRAKDTTAAVNLCQEGILLIMTTLEQATNSTSASVSSLFPLNARLWRWLALATEEGAVLRVDMAKAHNMALLRRDVDTAATLLNCMLRDLLQNSQVEQAQKLLSNSTFPETASNNQLCRFLYYSGRIQALRLEYTSSYSNLSQSLRKAPTNTALGFRIAAQRLLVVVQLLMGEIPERPVFFTAGMKQELEPYLLITQAVRRGDLAVFTKVVSEQKERLQADETYTLISRLAHQVVKAGLRKLQVSYSRLSLQDVADRLGLASAQQAEFVVAKAVRDGVLDATLHPKEGYVQSHDLVNVYATKEPAEAFHRRIAYCLTTHNDAVRAMRYPPDAYKKQLEASRGNRRRRGGEDKTDEEKAAELEDELDEDY